MTIWQGSSLGAIAIFLLVVVPIIIREVKHIRVHILGEHFIGYLVRKNYKDFIIVEKTKNQVQRYYVCTIDAKSRISPVIHEERDIDMTLRGKLAYNTLDMAKSRLAEIREEVEKVIEPDPEPRIVYASRSTKLDMIDDA